MSKYGELMNRVFEVPAHLKNDPYFIKLTELVEKCSKHNNGCVWRLKTKAFGLGYCPQLDHCRYFWDNSVCQPTPLNKARYNFLLGELRKIILIEEVA